MERDLQYRKLLDSLHGCGAISEGERAEELATPPAEEPSWLQNVDYSQVICSTENSGEPSGEEAMTNNQELPNLTTSRPTENRKT